MKTAKEIFLTVGIPIVKRSAISYASSRAFSEQDIAEIQREAKASLGHDIMQVLVSLRTSKPEQADRLLCDLMASIGHALIDER